MIGQSSATRAVAVFLLAVLLSGSVRWSFAEEAAGNGCLQCHAYAPSDFSTAHGFASDNCVACHDGDSSAESEESAHRGLIAFPGNLNNAQLACGSCHAGMVEAVQNSLMHRGTGLVRTTRAVLDSDMGDPHTQNLQSLGHTVADSLLRKQCASCHLGQPKPAHAVNATLDRGGGCLACHISEHPEGAHPALQREVGTGQCFGCHSRSSRISLSYTGLAEVDDSPLRLADRRTVERRPADHHYEAGLSCVDCHGLGDLKGHSDALSKKDAVAAACTDCHEPHVDERHARLDCSSCHSQWAPQCHGCHLEYDEAGEQWDHVERRTTPGAWHDRRWNVRNTLPALGVDVDNRITPFVPGMIMTIEHPEWGEEQFFRLFAPLVPHTTGPARSCESCHRSSEALGLGQGVLRLLGDTLKFEAAQPLRRDGLPADAWTNLDNSLGGRAPHPGQRPFTTEEMLRIFSVELQQDSLPAGGSGRSSSSSSVSNTGGTNSTSGRRAPPAP